MVKYFSRVVLVGLLTTVVVGCGAPEPEVILDKQTAVKLQAERDAQEKAVLEADAATMKADPNFKQ